MKRRWAYFILFLSGVTVIAGFATVLFTINSSSLLAPDALVSAQDFRLVIFGMLAGISGVGVFIFVLVTGE